MVWKMAARRDLFCFAENKKHPALVSMSYPRTFNLALLRWHAMHLGTRVCLLSPPLTESSVTGTKKGIYKVVAPNVTTLWQSRWWIDSRVCFKWGRKGFRSSRHPWRGWGGCNPQRDASSAVGTNVYDCHMHNQASLKSVCSNSSITLASAFFFHADARAFCGRVGFLNCMWVQFCSIILLKH